MQIIQDNEEHLLDRPHHIKDRASQIKKLTLYSILVVYAIFLSFFSLAWIITMIKMDSLCSSYIPYFCLILFGSLSYLFMIGVNIFSFFKKNYSNTRVTFCSICFGVGVVLKIAFVIYTFVIYNRSYGDCYLPYKKQVYYIVGCIVEIIGLSICFIFWKKDENLKKL